MQTHVFATLKDGESEASRPFREHDIWIAFVNVVRTGNILTFSPNFSNSLHKTSADAASVLFQVSD